MPVQDASPRGQTIGARRVRRMGRTETGQRSEAKARARSIARSPAGASGSMARSRDAEGRAGPPVAARQKSLRAAFDGLRAIGSSQVSDRSSSRSRPITFTSSSRPTPAPRSRGASKASRVAARELSTALGRDGGGSGPTAITPTLSRRRARRGTPSPTVLLNFCKHLHATPNLDPRSSGRAFDGLVASIQAAPGRRRRPAADLAGVGWQLAEGGRPPRRPRDASPILNWHCFVAASSGDGGVDGGDQKMAPFC